MSLQAWFVATVSLLGGASLILFGLRFLSEGLQVLFRTELRQMLSAIGKVPLVGTMVGAVTAFIVQSSYTTSLMALGYSGSGLFNRSQLASFLVGANLGTLLTVWLFVPDFGHLHLLMMGLGVLPMLYSRGKILPHLGRVLFAIGLLWLGYRLIVGGLAPASFFRVWAADSLTLMEHSFKSFWVVIAIASGFAFVLRSTVVTIAIAMVLTSQDYIVPLTGCIFVLGFNWGNTLSVLWSSRLSGPVAIQGALMNFTVQSLALITTFIFFQAFYFSAIEGLNLFTGRELAGYEWGFVLLPMTHVMFNLGIFALFFVLRIPLGKFAESVVSSKKKRRQKFQLIGSISHSSAILAVEQARQEVIKMVAMVSSMLNMAHEKTFPSRSSTDTEIDDNNKRIKKYEVITDNFHEEATDFLSKVMEMHLAPEQAREVRVLLRLLDDLEDIADYCRSISEYLDRSEGIPREDEELMANIDSLFGEVRDYFEGLLGQLTGDFLDVTQHKGSESFAKKLDRVFANLHDRIGAQTKGPPSLPLIRIVTDLQNIRRRSMSALELVESLP